MGTGPILASLFLSIILLFGATSCAEPPSMEQYVLTEDAPGGEYSFLLDMADTTATYTVKVLLVEDVPLPRRASTGPIPLIMKWKTPSGNTVQEKVWMGRGEDILFENYFTRHLFSTYREGIIPSEYGRWTFIVSVPPAEVSSHRLRGAGVSLVKSGPLQGEGPE